MEPIFEKKSGRSPSKVGVASQVQRGNGADSCPTIESHVLDAFLALGWITPALHKKPFDFYFQVG